MTYRERVLAAIYRKQDVLDRLPSQVDFNQNNQGKIAEHLNIPKEEVPFSYDNHLAYVPLNDRLPAEAESDIQFDQWGIGWHIGYNYEGAFVKVYPLEDIEKYSRYRFPDPDEEGLMDTARELVEKYQGKYFLLTMQPFTTFERAWALRGFTNFLIDLKQNKSFAIELLDRITDYQVRVSRRFVETGVDGGFTGDDFGIQSGMLFSPHLWREIFKPRLKKIWAVYQTAGLPVFYHSDGDIRPIIPDMIEAGVNVLHPLQPEVMPVEEMAEKYADKLSFFGGIGGQELARKRPREIAAMVKRNIEILGIRGGLIIGPSPVITSDVPLENVEALVGAIRRYGKR